MNNMYLYNSWTPEYDAMLTRAMNLLKLIRAQDYNPGDKRVVDKDEDGKPTNVDEYIDSNFNKE